MAESKEYLSPFKKHRMFPSVRFLITVLAFTACFVKEGSNSALNFSIVCMVNSSMYVENHSNTTSCSLSGTNGYNGAYDWDRKTQSYVISATNFGTMISIFAGGVICDKFGVKRLYIVASLILCLTNLIIPVVADHLGWIGLFVVRFVQGSTMVTGWPALLVVSNQWFVGGEMTFFMAVSSSGMLVGAIAAQLISGNFCHHVGWRYIFYLFGAFSGVMALLWTILYSDTAEKAMLIGEGEMQYIVQGRKWTHQKHSTPWRSLLTSLPVWAILIVNFGIMYMFYFIGQSSPTYYKEVLGINPGASAIFSALPFLCVLIGRNIGSAVLEACHGKISLTLFVKLATIPSGIIPGILMFVVTAFDCETKYGAVAIFALSFFFFSWVLVGFIKSTASIAPQYTGTISGLSDTTGYLSAIVSPFIMGALTPHSSVSEWKNAFYVTGSVSLLGSIFFIIFGSAEVQPWAILLRTKIDGETFGNKSRTKKIPDHRQSAKAEVIVIGNNRPDISGEVAY